MTLTAGPAAADDAELHAAWDDILGTYVAAGDDGVNRFDYGGLKANAEDSAKLDAYLESFAALDIETLDDDEQFAAYSNIYNALTVQYIVGRYPTKSIRSGFIVGPWKRVFTEINGEKVS